VCINLIKKLYSCLKRPVTLVFLVYFIFSAAFSLYRYKNFFTTHFDMSTMNQPTYNTYMALKTGDFSRILEMTDPHENRGQISRLNYHFDLILIPLSLFYFVYSGPETLLIIQAFFLALAVFPLYKISQHVLKDIGNKEPLSLMFCFIYISYFPLINSLLHNFHPVSLAPTFILYMIYFSLVEKYTLSLFFFLLSLLLKENVALTTLFYGFSYLLYGYFHKIKLTRRGAMYVFTLIVFSSLWFYLVMAIFMPHFRNGQSFYIGYYFAYGGSFKEIIFSLISNPFKVVRGVFSAESLVYYLSTLAPLLFIPLLSPTFFLAAIPEYLLNVLSSNSHMHSALYQYETVLLPYVFVSLLFGFKFLVDYFRPEVGRRLLRIILVSSLSFTIILGGYHLLSTLAASHIPISEEVKKEVKYWEQKLSSDKIRVAASYYVSPFFSSRQYLYFVPAVVDYKEADYVLLLTSDLRGSGVERTFSKELDEDSTFSLIRSVDGFKVYKATHD